MKKVLKSFKDNTKNGNQKKLVEQFNGEDLGKFQSVEQLFNAYFELEKAYTKKCQALAELKNSINNSSVLDFESKKVDPSCVDLERRIDNSSFEHLSADSTTDSAQENFVENEHGGCLDFVDATNSSLAVNSSCLVDADKKSFNDNFSHNDVCADCASSFDEINDAKSDGIIAVRDAENDSIICNIGDGDGAGAHDFKLHNSSNLHNQGNAKIPVYALPFWQSDLYQFFESFPVARVVERAGIDRLIADHDLACLPNAIEMAFAVELGRAVLGVLDAPKLFDWFATNDKIKKKVLSEYLNGLKSKSFAPPISFSATIPVASSRKRFSSIREASDSLLNC